jgi:perosamine synthetase
MLKTIKKKISFWDPIIGKKEIKYINSAIKMNWPNEGNFTYDFEKKIEKLLKVKHAVCTTSGTISIFLALKSLNISIKDEVIIPDITFGATAMAVKLTGAKLVLVDVDENSRSFDLNKLKQKINKKTKAIIPVHISGRAAEMDEIMNIAKKKNIYIIEDAAEALISKYKNKYLGTIGDLGCFSLTASKIITTGQGGVVVTNDTKLYHRIKLLKNQGIIGRSDGGNVKHEIIGYNFKYTNLQAAMGIAQISSINKRATKQIKIYHFYKKKLKDVKEIKILNFDTKNGEVPLWIDAYAFKKRDKLIDFLKKNKIECRKFWYPLHMQKPFKEKNNNYKVSTKIYKNLFWLPSSLNLNEKKISKVCDLIKFFYKLN